MNIRIISAIAALFLLACPGTIPAEAKRTAVETEDGVNIAITGLATGVVREIRAGAPGPRGVDSHGGETRYITGGHYVVEPARRLEFAPGARFGFSFRTPSADAVLLLTLEADIPLDSGHRRTVSADYRYRLDDGAPLRIVYWECRTRGPHADAARDGRYRLRLLNHGRVLAEAAFELHGPPRGPAGF
ncbi:MAG: hypothetical protein ACLFOY_16505 [Desulfatibacillaceae bacterium]